MNVNVEDLKKQLDATEVAFEQAKAHLYRLDGVAQTLRGLIVEAEKPVEKKKKDAPKDA